MSTIIKSSDALQLGAIAPLRFAEIASRDSTGDATPRAETIVEQARPEADAIREAARQEGRAAALAEVQRQYQERFDRELGQALAAIRQAATEIAVAKSRWLSHWEHAAVHVAVAIAERLVRRELRDAPEITLELVREALALAAGSSDVQVRLHPNDYELLRPRVESLARELRTSDEARIVADPQIRPGGCRIDTRFGSIDQQIESQLARIEDELN